MKNSDILWCCHVRGNDDVYAAPDYETALLWADWLNLSCVPKHQYDPWLRAVPAPWPHSADGHAANLNDSIAGFTPRDGSALAGAVAGLRDAMFATLPSGKDVHNGS